MSRRWRSGALVTLVLLGCQREQLATRIAEPAPNAREAAGPAPDRVHPEPLASGAPTAPPPPSILASLPANPPVLAPFGADVVQGRAVVTSVEAQATAIGVRVLEAGGNAVDAAVAVAFALAVTHPSAGNIGGGGFLLLRLGDVVEAIDFREDSPAKLTDEEFNRLIRQHARTPSSVGVPGTVAGLYLAHERHGRLPWPVLLEGAITLARQGSIVGPRQARTFGWSRQKLSASAAGRRAFLPGGKVPVSGQRLLQPQLAVALERIRDGGPAGFYAGPTADDLVRSLGTSGLITLEDLSTYRALVRAPLTIDYRGVRIVTMPPPSGGGPALVAMLAMLDQAHVEQTAPGSVARLHLLAETSRRAQVERQLNVSPPGVEPADVEMALQRRWQTAQPWLFEHPIDPAHKTDSAALDARFTQILAESEQTTHLSVVDAEGGVVSCTVTLSASFGTGIVTEETGIVLNNAVGSFAKVGKNQPLPGVRTVSSMAPTLAFVGPRDVLVLGTPGGDTIPSTIAQLIVALVDDRQTLAQAVQAPRIFQGFVPDELSTERDRPLPAPVVRGLGQLGHRVRASRAAIGDANIAAYFAGRAGGVHDEREGGEARALDIPE
jgi:gamma-glutamyltranspeptidase/glutathione hydrolase